MAFNTWVGKLFSSTGDIIAPGPTSDDEPDEAKTICRPCEALHAYRFSAWHKPDPVDLRTDELFDLEAGTLDLDLAFKARKRLQQLVAQRLGYNYTVIGTFLYAYQDRVRNAFMARSAMGPLIQLYFDRRLE